MALLLAACSEGGIASWEALTTIEPTAAIPAPAPTTTLPAPELGIESLDELYVFIGLGDPPTAYHFSTNIEYPPDSGYDTIDLEGDIGGDDFHYVSWAPWGSTEYLYVDGTLFLNWDGVWAVPDDQEPPSDAISYFFARSVVLTSINETGSLEPIEPIETNGRPTAGYRVTVSEIANSAPIGGSRTVDLWVTEDGVLVRFVLDTVPPSGVEYLDTNHAEWQMTNLGEPAEINPPDTDTVIVGG